MFLCLVRVAYLHAVNEVIEAISSLMIDPQSSYNSTRHRCQALPKSEWL